MRRTWMSLAGFLAGSLFASTASAQDTVSVTAIFPQYDGEPRYQMIWDFREKLEEVNEILGSSDVDLQLELRAVYRDTLGYQVPISRVYELWIGNQQGRSIDSLDVPATTLKIGLVDRVVDDPRCSMAKQGRYANDGTFEPGAIIFGSDCNAYQLAHAIGHSLGLVHDAFGSESEMIDPRAVSYGVNGDFHTIMGDPTRYISAQSKKATALPYYSSPTRNCLGTPCGVPGVADAVSVLNNLSQPLIAVTRLPLEEEGNRFETSTTLYEGANSFTFDFKQDVDFFTLELDEYTRVDAGEEGFDAWLTEDKQVIWRNVSTQSRNAQVLPPGIYYFVKEGRIRSYGEPKPYEIELTLTSVEPAQAMTVLTQKGDGHVRKVTDKLTGASCEFVQNSCRLQVIEGQPLVLTFESSVRTSRADLSECNGYASTGCIVRGGENAVVTTAALAENSIATMNATPATAKPLSATQLTHDVLMERESERYYRFSLQTSASRFLWFDGNADVAVEVFDQQWNRVRYYPALRQLSLGVSGYSVDLRLPAGNYWLKATMNNSSQSFYSRQVNFALTRSNSPHSVTVLLDNETVTSLDIESDMPFEHQNYGAEQQILMVPGASIVVSLQPRNGYFQRFQNCPRLTENGCHVAPDSPAQRLHIQTDRDNDGDGLPDSWQAQYDDIGAATADPDGDGLSNITEFRALGNPLSADTDRDGLSDGDEYRVGLQLNHDDRGLDNDGDGLTNSAEVNKYQTDPFAYRTSVGMHDLQRIAREQRLLGYVENAAHDYDGDGRADHAFYAPDTGEYHVLASALGQWLTYQMSDEGGVPVPADYDGDGLFDAAIYHAQTQRWTVRLSHFGQIAQFVAPMTHDDIPLAADWNGDGVSDIGWRSPGAGRFSFYVAGASGLANVIFGESSDSVPLVFRSGYNQQAGLALHQPSQNQWLLLYEGQYQNKQALGYQRQDIPFIADLNGDGSNSLVIRRPSEQRWYYRSINTVSPGPNYEPILSVSFGRNATDIPLLYDVNGDGADDMIIYRHAERRLYWRSVYGPSTIHSLAIPIQGELIPAAAPLRFKISDLPWSNQ